MKQAIILAGGKGSRLKSVVSDVPKPMAPVGGKPFLEVVLDKLVVENFTHVFLATGFMAESVEDYFGNTYKSLQMCYAPELEPLGTGGAMKNACLHPKFNIDEKCFILNGDSFVDLNYQKMLEHHQRTNATMTVALKDMKKPHRYGTVELDKNNRILEFREKDNQIEEGLINAGVYLLDSARILTEMKKDAFSFEKEVLEKKTKEWNINGYTETGYFIDIGIPEDYERAQHYFS